MRTVDTIKKELNAAEYKAASLRDELRILNKNTYPQLEAYCDHPAGITGRVQKLIDNAAKVRELLAPFDGTLTDDQADAAERVFAAPSSAVAYGEAIYNRGTYLECPACGGSGHIGDARSVAANIPDERIDAAVVAFYRGAMMPGIPPTQYREPMRRAITALYASKDVTIDE